MAGWCIGLLFGYFFLSAIGEVRKTKFFPEALPKSLNAKWNLQQPFRRRQWTDVQE